MRLVATARRKPDILVEREIGTSKDKGPWCDASDRWILCDNAASTRVGTKEGE